jgi:acyl-coenzyme A synthetase/AMP-(fatty) acid ligase
MKTRHALFSEPQQPFAFHDQRLLRIADLQQAVGNVQENLHAHINRCAIYCEHSANFAALLLAVLLSGREAIVLPSNQPAFIDAIRDSYDCVLTDADVLWHAEQSQTATQLPLQDIDAATAAIVFFTSGSTGEPKAVSKKWLHLLAEVHVLESLWGQRVGNALIAGTVSQQHLYGFLFRVLWPLLTGRTVLSEQWRFPEQITAGIAQHGNIALVSSPALLKRLPELLDLSDVHQQLAAMFSSGGPLPADSASRLHAMLQQPVIEILGSTETGGFAWRTPTADTRRWTLFPDVRIETIDDNLQLHSPFLPETTALDDTGFLDEDGYLHLQGRRDNVVKIEEKRVSLQEIENRILATGLVADVRAVLLQTPLLPVKRDSAAAVVVLNAAGNTILQTNGKRHLCQQLEAALHLYFERIVVPRKWRFVAQLPVNDMGKISHADLLALFDNAHQKKQPDVLAKDIGKDSAVLSLRIPADLYYFRGHFPDHPIVPGVVQLLWAEHFMHSCLDHALPVKDMEAVKFQQLMLPGQHVQLQLRLDREKNKLHFDFSAADKKFSSGRLLLETLPATLPEHTG